MTKPYTKKEVVYYVDTDTVEGLKRAERLRSDLYDTYDDVLITPNGSVIKLYRKLPITAIVAPAINPVQPAHIFFPPTLKTCHEKR